MKINLVHDRHDEPLEALPVGAEEAPKSIQTVWGLFEVLLKAPDRLNPFVRTPGLQWKLSIGFAAITFVGMGLYALMLWLVLLFVPQEARPGFINEGWQGDLAPPLGLVAAYPGAILLATVIVLPSYWFLGALSGVKMPMVEVLTHSLKGKAATTVLLLGLMPIYVVLMVVLILSGPGGIFGTLFPALGVWIGLLLPFAAAFRGAGAVASGLRNVVASTPRLTRGQRVAIPDSLMVSWAILFTLTCPVVMFKCWEQVTVWLSA